MTRSDRPTDSTTMTEVARWHDGSGTRLAYSPTGDRWVAVDHATAHFWRDERLEWSLPLAGRFVGDVRFTADGRFVLLSPEIVDLEARAFVDLPSLEELTTPDVELRPDPREFELSGAALSADGSRLALSVVHRPLRGLGAPSAYEGPPARLIVADGRTRALVGVLFEGAPDVELTPLVMVERSLVAGGLPVTVWDDDGQVAVLDGHTTTVRAVSASQDGSRVATAGWDGTVVVWDSGSWEVVASWTAHGGDPVNAVALGVDGRTVATAGADLSVRVWSVDAEPVPSASFEPGGEPVGVALHPANGRLLIAVDDGNLVLADAGREEVRSG